MDFEDLGFMTIEDLEEMTTEELSEYSIYLVRLFYHRCMEEMMVVKGIEMYEDTDKWLEDAQAAGAKIAEVKLAMKELKTWSSGRKIKWRRSKLATDLHKKYEDYTNDED